MIYDATSRESLKNLLCALSVAGLMTYVGIKSSQKRTVLLIEAHDQKSQENYQGIINQSFLTDNIEKSSLTQDSTEYFIKEQENFKEYVEDKNLAYTNSHTQTELYSQVDREKICVLRKNCRMIIDHLKYKRSLKVYIFFIVLIALLMKKREKNRFNSKIEDQETSNDTISQDTADTSLEVRDFTNTVYMSRDLSNMSAKENPYNIEEEIVDICSIEEEAVVNTDTLKEITCIDEPQENLDSSLENTERITSFKNGEIIGHNQTDQKSSSFLLLPIFLILFCSFLKKSHVKKETSLEKKDITSEPSKKINKSYSPQTQVTRIEKPKLDEITSEAIAKNRQENSDKKSEKKKKPLQNEKENLDEKISYQSEESSLHKKNPQPLRDNLYNKDNKNDSRSLLPSLRSI
jgi:hypothetical protein